MESLESLRVDLPVEVLRPRRTRSRRPESRTGAKADALERDLLAVRARLDTVERALSARTSEVIDLRCERALRDHSLTRFGRRTRALAGEVDRLRSHPLLRLLGRWDRFDLRERLDDRLAKLLQDGVAGSDPRPFRLRPSVNLQSVPFVPYGLPSLGRALCGLQLAVVVDLPHSTGTVGIELVSGGRILVHATSPLAGVQDDTPTGFGFAPVWDPWPGAVELRVFARDAETPVRVLEWSRHGLWGLGPERRLAFAWPAYAVPAAADAGGVVP